MIYMCYVQVMMRLQQRDTWSHGMDLLTLSKYQLGVIKAWEFNFHVTATYGARDQLKWA